MVRYIVIPDTTKLGSILSIYLRGFRVVGSNIFSQKLQRLDPFMHYKHYKRNERDVEAKAMINLLAKTISYANWYMIYLNEHYKTADNSEEDW